MTATIGIESVISLVSAIFLLSLSVVSLCTGPKERSWRRLALFAGSLAVCSSSVFLASQVENYTEAMLLIRVAFVSLSMSILFAYMYSFSLARRASRSLLVKWLYASRLRLIASWVIGCALIGLALGTDWLAKGVIVSANGGTRMIYGPAIYPAFLLSVMGVWKIARVIRGAFRESTDKDYRTYLWMHAVAFLAIYLPAFAIQILEPFVNVKLDLIVFAAFPFSVTVLFVAFLRYERARVAALTEGLQREVQRQTSAVKKLHAKLSQRDKSASLGMVIASVAHEINNPLGAIYSMTDCSARATERIRARLRDSEARAVQDDDFDRAVAVIESANKVMNDGVGRISRFVERLKGFITLDEAETQLTDIHHGIDDAVMILEPNTPRRVTIQKEYGAVSPVMCRPGQLNQVFLDLIQNAIQAIDGEGRITIATAEAGGNVRIAITDSGHGIPMEDMEKIFESGFTTKPVQGIGLGLAMSRQILEDHQGDIQVRSEPGLGTTFTIILPSCDLQDWVSNRSPASRKGSPIGKKAENTQTAQNSATDDSSLATRGVA